MARIIDKSYTRICRTTKPQIVKKTRARKSQKGDGLFDLDYELPREAQRIVKRTSSNDDHPSAPLARPGVPMRRCWLATMTVPHGGPYYHHGFCPACQQA